MIDLYYIIIFPWEQLSAAPFFVIYMLDMPKRSFDVLKNFDIQLDIVIMYVISIKKHI